MHIINVYHYINEIAMDPSEIFGELSFAARKMTNYFDAQIRGHGLTLSRARALVHLSKPRTWTQGDLAKELEIEHTTAVRLVDGLEKLNLIERHPVPGDRRANHLRLTPAAQPHIEAIQEVLEAARETLLRDISQEDLEVTIKVLQKLSKQADAATQIHSSSREAL